MPSNVGGVLALLANRAWRGNVAEGGVWRKENCVYDVPAGSCQTELRPPDAYDVEGMLHSMREGSIDREVVCPLRFYMPLTNHVHHHATNRVRHPVGYGVRQ